MWTMTTITMDTSAQDGTDLKTELKSNKDKNEKAKEQMANYEKLLGKSEEAYAVLAKTLQEIKDKLGGEDGLRKFAGKVDQDLRCYDPANAQAEVNQFQCKLDNQRKTRDQIKNALDTAKVGYDQAQTTFDKLLGTFYKYVGEKSKNEPGVSEQYKADVAALADLRKQIESEKQKARKWFLATEFKVTLNRCASNAGSAGGQSSTPSAGGASSTQSQCSQSSSDATAPCIGLGALIEPADLKTRLDKLLIEIRDEGDRLVNAWAKYNNERLRLEVAESALAELQKQRRESILKKLEDVTLGCKA